MTSHVIDQRAPDCFACGLFQIGGERRQCAECSEFFCLEHMDAGTICNGCKTVGSSDVEYPRAEND
jgi:hypothetical protein